jgi:ribosomal protein L16/L10AE
MILDAQDVLIAVHHTIFLVGMSMVDAHNLVVFQVQWVTKHGINSARQAISRGLQRTAGNI